MILFSQNSAFGQLYAESVQGADWRIPTDSVDSFLAALDISLDELLARPQYDTET